VHAFISDKRDRVNEICPRHHVQRLEVFGSATSNEFDVLHSDVDLIVHFDATAQRDLVEAYFGLKADLEGLFGRPVDLLTSMRVRNPYLRESIESSRQTLYAA